MPTISVLINCFNYRGFVVEAVESALRQSRPPDQIVIVDDGSTDGSGELLTEKFARIPNVEIVLQRNRGQLSAIAAAFQRATGDLIFLLDADDRYQPDHLERVASVYEARRDVDFIFTGMKEFGDRAERRLFLPKDHYFASSVIRSLNAAEWIGEATSALSCRRWVMEAMLPVFLELAPQWKIRADDCVLRGSSTVGARKLFLAVTTVDYRVHGSNSFANRALDLAHHRQHFVRTLCFINRMNRHVGLEPDMIGRAHLEFELIPEPRRQDFDSYWSLVKSASFLWWATKFKMWWHMRRHFKRCGQKD